MDEPLCDRGRREKRSHCLNERVSSLDDYDVQESVAVNLPVNSSVFRPEAKTQLDTLAAKALTARAT